MIVTFVLGVAAGWCALAAEARLRPLVEQYLPGRTPDAPEMRAISLSACILLAALVAVLLGEGGAFALALGAVLGVIGPRLYDKFRSMRAPDYDS